MASEHPEISIITIVKNDASALERTISSVSQQVLKSFEFIIVDGGSADGTLDVIKSHTDCVSSWISEPDHGIYDAMNKGLAHATGDWVIFLNAGDTFSNQEVLQRILSDGSPNASIFLSSVNQDTEHRVTDTVHDPGIISTGAGDAEVIYGDSIADYGQFQIYRKAGSPADLWKGMFCNHQSMLFRRKLFFHREFRTDLDIAGDHEFIYRIHSEGFTFAYLPIPVVTWHTRGVSNRRQVKSVVERYKMVKQYHRYSLSRKCYYLLLLLLAAMVKVAYLIIPGSLMMPVIKFINKRNLVRS